MGKVLRRELRDQLRRILEPRLEVGNLDDRPGLDLAGGPGAW